MTPGARWAVAVLFVLVLAIGGLNLLFTAHEVNAVRAAQVSVVQLCQAGNESRAQQVSLWDHLVAISRPPPHETPAQARKRLATTRAFLAYIRKVFAPRNCTGRFS